MDLYKDSAIKFDGQSRLWMWLNVLQHSTESK